MSMDFVLMHISIIIRSNLHSVILQIISRILVQLKQTKMDDWRSESQRLSNLFMKFYRSKDFEQSADVQFVLPNGSKVKAHKVVLAVASEVFNAQFFGVLSENLIEFKVSDSIKSETFIIMIETIYNSGLIKDLSIPQIMDLLYASNFYLLHGNIKRCHYIIMDHLSEIENLEELSTWALSLSQLSIHEKIYSYCRDIILAYLPRVLEEGKLNIFDSKVQVELIKDLQHSISGYDWDKYETDQEHFWRLMDFAQDNQIQNLEDYCLKEIKELLPKCFPALLVHHITRASKTPRANSIFKEGIKVFVASTLNFRWFIELEGVLWHIDKISE